MKRENTNRVNMINSMVTYCDANAAETMGIPQFGLKLTEVKDKMILVNSLNQIGSASSKGVTLDTNLIRGAMTNLAYKCANAVLAYANDVKNNTLKELVNLKMSDFEREKKEDVDDLCQRVHDAANIHFAEAVNYGMAPTDVSDLQVSIDLFRVSSQNPRQAIITASQAKKQADLLIKEVINDLLVGKLDTMANTLRFSNQEFWSGYFQARIIINIGSTSTKVRGTVLNEGDVPLIGVMFRIMETGTQNEVARVFSGERGKFSASKLPSGYFDFEWSFAGYSTVRQTNVRLSPGKELQRKVVMQEAVTRQGNLDIGNTANIDFGDIDVDDATATLEATDTTMSFFASNTPNGGQTGPAAITVNPGSPFQNKVSEMIAQLGLGPANPYFNVQNVGGSFGGWKVTIEM